MSETPSTCPHCGARRQPDLTDLAVYGCGTTTHRAAYFYRGKVCYEREITAERHHADRLAECLYRTDDAASSVQDWSGTYLGDVLEEASEALAAHEARRKGGAV